MKARKQSKIDANARYMSELVTTKFEEDMYDHKFLRGADSSEMSAWDGVQAQLRRPWEVERWFLIERPFYLTNPAFMVGTG